MPWLDQTQIQLTLEKCFNQILTSRMHGVPVINPALKVQALDFKQVNQEWLGILITPWFMNLLLLPNIDSEWPALSPGETIKRHFPYGDFEFTTAYEAQLGVYASCSLFSPMFEFAEQADALSAAQAALQALLTNPTPRTLSRRDLLRVKLGN